MMATWHHLINKGQAQRPLGNLVSFLSPANATAVIFQQTRPTQRNFPMTLLKQQMLESVLTFARPQPTCSTQRSTPCYSGSLPFLNSKNYQMFRECKLRELSWGAREGRGHLNPLGLFCLYCLSHVLLSTLRFVTRRLHLATSLGWRQGLSHLPATHSWHLNTLVPRRCLINECMCV